LNGETRQLLKLGRIQLAVGVRTYPDHSGEEVAYPGDAERNGVADGEERCVVNFSVALNNAGVVDAVDVSVDAVASGLVFERVFSDTIPLGTIAAAHEHLPNK